jgi:hypothetical protein
MAYDLQFTKRPFAPAEGSDGDDESDEETFADAFAARSKNIADKRPKTSKIATGPPGRGADTTTDDEWESLDQSACGFFRTGGNIKTAAEIRASGIERATELLRRLDRVTGNLYQPAAAAWLQTIRRGAADVVDEALSSLPSRGVVQRDAAAAPAARTEADADRVRRETRSKARGVTYRRLFVLFSMRKGASLCPGSAGA